jgi:hypothetical protein
LRILGVDFTSAPSKTKAITVARGIARKSVLQIEDIEDLKTFDAFERLLQRPGPWIGGFDFPFGLPRDALKAFGWPEDWEKMVRHCARIGRAKFAQRLNEDRISRPVGGKYRYRRGDRLAGSSPAVRLHQVPVGFMFLEGAPRLANAGVHIPMLRENGANRIALEAYPGYLTKAQLGVVSYKSDERRKQTQQRENNRRAIVENIRRGKPLGIRLEAPRSILQSLIEDPSGDRLDSTLCALQAAWGWQNRKNQYGLPRTLDPVEGWIVTVKNK